MKVTVLPILLFLVLASTAPSQTGPAPKGIVLKDILDGIRDSEKSLSTVSITSMYENYPIGIVPNLKKPLRSRVTYTVDSKGRFRYEETGETVAQDGTVLDSQEYRCTYDGSEVRTLNILLKRGMLAGSLMGVSRKLNPREFTTSFNDVPVYKYFDKQPGRIVGEVKWDGRSVTVIELLLFTDESTGVMKKGRFLVDVGRGFVVVKKSFLLRYPGMKDWKEYDLLESHDFREASPGIWLPSRVLTEYYSDRAEPELLVRNVIRNERCLANIECPDSLFTQNFPPGSFVEDKIKGVVYRIGHTTDEKIMLAKAEATELQQHIRPRPIWRLLIMVNIVAILVFFAFKLFWRKRTIPPGGTNG